MTRDADYLFSQRIERLASEMGFTKKEVEKVVIEEFLKDTEFASRFRQIYAIEDGLGNVKIGTADHPPTRLATLQIGSPVVYTLFGNTASFPGLESTVHKHLKKYRVRGEWFTHEGETRVVTALIRDKKTVELADLLGVECGLAIPSGMDDVFSSAMFNPYGKR